MTGLYIHIPFCRRKCPFCDYYSFSHAPEWLQESYAAVLEKQVTGLSTPVATLYVGGGTPLAMGQLRLARVLSGVPPVVESTLELNPEDMVELTDTVLEHFTRLSVGVQSFSERVLQVLRRTAADPNLIRELTAHWDVNVDLLVGVPGQTEVEVLRDIEKAIELGVNHVSVYPLEIHYGTPFYARYQDWDWDDAELLLEIETMLTSAGYEHYEISNYAKPGHQCLHNRLYWLDEDYVALGPSAAGHLSNVRYKWTSNIRKYVESVENGQAAFEEYMVMSEGEQISEYAVMNLRLLQEGIRRDRVTERFGEAAWHRLVGMAESNPFLVVGEQAIRVSNWLFFNRAALSFI